MQTVRKSLLGSSLHYLTLSLILSLPHFPSTAHFSLILINFPCLERHVRPLSVSLREVFLTHFPGHLRSERMGSPPPCLFHLLLRGTLNLVAVLEVLSPSSSFPLSLSFPGSTWVCRALSFRGDKAPFSIHFGFLAFGLGSLGWTPSSRRLPTHPSDGRAQQQPQPNGKGAGKSEKCQPLVEKGQWSAGLPSCPFFLRAGFTARTAPCPGWALM